MKKIRSRNFLRFVSVALSFGLMVGGLSVSADSTDAYGKEMLYEELQQWQPDYTEPEIISEDISKRGEFEKHFLRNDGSYVVASYPEPVHELVDGQWQEIDNTLSPENGRLENKADNFSTSFARSPGSGRMVSLGSQGHDLSWNIEAQALSPQIRSASSAVKIVPDPKVEAVIQEVTAPISQSETMADEDKMTVSKTASGIKYSDVLGDGVDIEYVVTPYKVKENVILRQAGNFVSYSMQMQTGGLKAVLKSNNTVELQDETGLVIYKIKTPYMYDADDEISYNIRVSVQQEGESCTITYIPDASWLHEEERVYPVVIDPTVISGQYASNYIDTYVAECDTSYHNDEVKMYVGIKSTSHGYVRHRAYTMIKQLPEIGVRSAVTSATFYARCLNGTSTSRPFDLSTINGRWYDTITWNTQPGSVKVACSVNRNTSTNWVAFSNLRDRIAEWYQEPTRNHGFMISYANESKVNPDYNSFYTSENTLEGSRPYLSVTYTTAAYGNPLWDGLYFIRNAESGQYLDAQNYGTANGTPVIPFAFNGGENQQWRVTSLYNGYYSIRPEYSTTLALDVSGGYTTSGSAIDVWNISGMDAATSVPNYCQWSLTNTGSDYFTLSPRSAGDSSLYLTQSGSSVIQQSGIGTNAQRWLFESAEKRVDFVGIDDEGANASAHNHWQVFEEIRPLLTDNIDAYPINTYHNITSASDMLSTMRQSNIFIFRGHGGVQDVLLTGGRYFLTDHLKPLGGDALSDTRFVMYMACFTAGGAPEVNLVNVTYSKGAKCVLGFSKSINCSVANPWMVRFFECLNNGDTINSAASQALDYVCEKTPDHQSYGLESYVILGAGNQKFVN